LNDQWVIEETRGEIFKFPEFNENENTIYCNIWDRAKAMPRGKFVAKSACEKQNKTKQKNTEIPNK
jgi:hypothetical protein